MTCTVRGVSAEGREGSCDKELKSEYTVVYLVTSDDKNDGPYQARTAFGIPSIGDLYNLGNDFDPQATVVEKTSTQRESPWEWEVEVTYSTEVGDKPDPETNPLLQPPEISFGFETRQKVVPGTYSQPELPGDLRRLEIGVVNSAGELFDPQPVMEIADPVLTIKKNIPYMSASWLMELANTVNSAEFYGAYPRTLRLKPPQTERAYDEQIGFYWPCTFEFVYRYDTWDLQILNVGTYYIDATLQVPGIRRKFAMVDGTPFVGLLGSTGGALNGSDADSNTHGRYVASGADPTFTTIKIYRELDFNSLGII